MTRDDARKRLESLARPRGVRLDVGPTLSSDERRAVASAAHESAKNEMTACDARIAEILAAHTELQQLYAKRRALRRKAELLNHARFYYKFRAMKGDGGFIWETMGNGDTWAEVVTRATERTKAEGVKTAERKRQAAFEKHRAADPHCTCPDCTVYHYEQQQQP